MSNESYDNFFIILMIILDPMSDRVFYFDYGKIMLGEDEENE